MIIGDLGSLLNLYTQSEMVITRALRLLGLHFILLACSKSNPLGDGFSITDILEVPVISIANPTASF
jgi:hypothetical protein